jgi:hypothetical protein
MNEEDLGSDYWVKIGHPEILPDLPDGWAWSVTPAHR